MLDSVVRWCGEKYVHSAGVSFPTPILSLRGAFNHAEVNSRRTEFINQGNDCISLC